MLSLVRFLTFADGATARAGVLRHGTVHPLPAGVRLVDLLGDDGTTLREAGNAALGTDGEVRPYSTVRLLAPIPDPPTVRDFMTFESHFAGARGLDNPIPPQWYEAPAFYFTNPYAVIGPDDPVPIDAHDAGFDDLARVDVEQPSGLERQLR